MPALSLTQILKRFTAQEEMIVQKNLYSITCAERDDNEVSLVSIRVQKIEVGESLPSISVQINNLTRMS